MANLYKNGNFGGMRRKTFIYRVFGSPPYGAVLILKIALSAMLAVCIKVFIYHIFLAFRQFLHVSRNDLSKHLLEPDIHSAFYYRYYLPACTQ